MTLAQDCFELGVILLRKKLYTQATKNLEKASRMWDAEPEELAQVHMFAQSRLSVKAEDAAGGSAHLSSTICGIWRCQAPRSAASLGMPCRAAAASVERSEALHGIAHAVLKLEHHLDWVNGLQVHNALGFAYFNMDRSELALKNYRRAVELQPGYTTAWNNLGDAYEKARDWDQVLPARDCECSLSLIWPSFWTLKALSNTRIADENVVTKQGGVPTSHCLVKHVNGPRVTEPPCIVCPADAMLSACDAGNEGLRGDTCIFTRQQGCTEPGEFASQQSQPGKVTCHAPRTGSEEVVDALGM